MSHHIHEDRLSRVGTRDRSPIPVIPTNTDSTALTKTARTLFVGNLPTQSNLTDEALTHFFTATITVCGISTPTPILKTWISKDSSYCFVEFRSVSDTTSALTLLQGTSMSGKELRIGRTSEYTPPPQELDSYIVPLPSQSSSSEMVPKPSIVSVSGISVQPTRILFLKDIITSKVMEDPEEYDDVLLDIAEECENVSGGTVTKTVIPRDGQFKGCGFVVFEEIESCDKAQSILHGRRFNKRTVRAKFFAEDRFKNL